MPIDQSDFFDLLHSKNLHHIEDNRGIDNLNKLSKLIGYQSDPFKYGSPFEMFLKDNPGCIEAIHNWMADNLSEQQLTDLGYTTFIKD